MGKTREIKKRIKAVGNIRRITSTMEKIARSRFARSLRRATASKPYTDGIFELVRQIAANSGGITHPLITGAADTGKPGKDLTLILTSDRGLCGPYNGAILRLVMQHLRADPAAKAGEIELVGKKGQAFLKYNNIGVSKTYTLGDKADFADAERIAQSYMDRFISGEIRRVNVVYMRFFSAGRQKPEIMQLLPLQSPASQTPASQTTAPGAEKTTRVEYEFSPPAPELLGTLLPAAVKGSLFQAVLDAIVSEHIARMVAMKSATDNAGKMGKKLTRQFNRARQAQITTELTEIISGAAALE